MLFEVANIRFVKNVHANLPAHFLLKLNCNFSPFANPPNFATPKNILMISIVAATVSDTSVLAKVGRRSLLESHGHSAPTEIMHAYVDEKFTEEALQQELADSANIFHIIYHNSEPAGYSKIIYNQQLEQFPQQRFTKLERLYLLSEFYDLKLGHQLLQYNIDLSKQNGEQGLWLYVWKENERAMRFYNKWGFEIVGDGWFRLTETHANPNWQMLLRYE